MYILKQKSLFLFCSFFCFFAYGQGDEKSFLAPKKIGFLYNYGVEDNFIFDDPDYTYEANIFKIQAFYNLGGWKSLDFELIVQPQIQIIQHQLENKHFIRPDSENFEEKRTEFTAPKTMHLYALEFGFSIKKEVLKRLDFHVTTSLGFAIIDTRTERVAKGFTFIENWSIGFSYKTTKKMSVYFGVNVGHVSNFDFQQPNNGYNIFGGEFGVAYTL